MKVYFSLNQDFLTLLPYTELSLYHINHVSYHIMSCHTISCHVISHHTIPCHVMSYHVISYHIISCHTMSCHVISCRFKNNTFYRWRNVQINKLITHSPSINRRGYFFLNQKYAKPLFFNNYVLFSYFFIF